MAADLPEYFFRIRDNGAAVFRVEAENRLRRLDLQQIAFANTRNGDIRPHGNRALSEAEVSAIRSWLDNRRSVLEQRSRDEVRHTIEQINMTAHWIQSDASHEEVSEVSDQLLLALHDLRSVLVRKMAAGIDADK